MFLFLIVLGTLVVASFLNCVLLRWFWRNATAGFLLVV